MLLHVDLGTQLTRVSVHERRLRTGGGKFSPPTQAVSIPYRKVVFSRPGGKALAAISGMCPTRQAGPEHGDCLLLDVPQPLGMRDTAVPPPLRRPTLGSLPWRKPSAWAGVTGLGGKSAGVCDGLGNWVTTDGLGPSGTRCKEPKQEACRLMPPWDWHWGAPSLWWCLVQVWAQPGQIIPSSQDKSEIVLQRLLAGSVCRAWDRVGSSSSTMGMEITLK